MQQALAHVSLLVRDYDEALAFYVGTLGFRLVEDSPRPDEGKRWVVVGLWPYFRDPYGNLWDLLQYNGSAASGVSTG